MANEWIEYGKEWRQFWIHDKLSRSGLLIEMNIEVYDHTEGEEDFHTRENKQFLIGDINENGGVCDDCRDFEMEDIVLRYKVVYEAEEEIIDLPECKDCPDNKEDYDCDPCTQPNRFPSFGPE